MDKRIEIDSFNPYESRFPNRKLVDKDALKLIKILRQEGYTVLVRPDNNTPIQYLFKKGVNQFLSDPVYLFLIGLPTAVITGLISNYIQKRLDSKKEQKTITNVYNNVIINDFSQKIVFNLNDKRYSLGEIKDRDQKKSTIKKEYAKSFSLISPYLDLPTPIFLEHTPRLVGWGKINITDIGLEIENCKVIDKNVFRKIQQGKIKGASITGIAEKSTCSICNQNYVECNHITGDIYEGTSCTNKIERALAVEVSLVKAPINPECLVNIKNG